MVNNADWLLNLNYIDFLRDSRRRIFRVNRMLTAECYKQRMERGLTFLEFNYMLMQSLRLPRAVSSATAARLQIGRRRPVEQHARRRGSHPPQGAQGCLCPDLQAAHDRATARRWARPKRAPCGWTRKSTIPYEFYQYWRNVDDADVEKLPERCSPSCPWTRCAAWARCQDEQINEAKRVLAFEVTKMIHGEAEAAEGCRRGAGAVSRAVPPARTCPPGR